MQLARLATSQALALLSRARTQTTACQIVSAFGIFVLNAQATSVWSAAQSVGRNLSVSVRRPRRDLRRRPLRPADTSERITGSRRL